MPTAETLMPRAQAIASTVDSITPLNWAIHWLLRCPKAIAFNRYVFDGVKLTQPSIA